LCYHGIDDEKRETSVTPENFEKHINLLQKKKYRFITLAEVVAYMQGEITLPKKAVALTFDDGYRSVYEKALPILLKYTIPATVFVVEHPDQKHLGNGAPILFESEISEMKQTGLITFGNHSKNHRMLDTLSGDDLKEEIGSGTYFAYPGGHYSKEAIQAVQEAGYEAAFSIRPGIVQKGDDRYLIKRNVITADMNLFMLGFHASIAADWYFGISRFIKKLISN
jgi:peptidoglycan/xylan/chitin deacetylase (PgdA/CDA1 family)